MTDTLGVIRGYLKQAMHDDLGSSRQHPVPSPNTVQCNPCLVSEADYQEQNLRIV